jgi:hypothetical protein
MEADMRITSSVVSLNSSRLDSKYSSKYEHLREWDEKSDLSMTSFEENGKVVKEEHKLKDTLQISKQDEQFSSVENGAPDEAQSQGNSLDQMLDDIDKDLRMRIIKDLVESLTGEEVETLNSDFLKKLRSYSDGSSNIAQKDIIDISRETSNSGPKRKGWGIDYFYKETNYSKEGFSFTASGNVTTDKGLEISFNASLQMSREQYSEIIISEKAGDALIDPLVIDFTGIGTALSDSKVDFDLDADGQIDSIRVPTKGTGFLAYDKNGNGVIDNGSELFGPSTGSGYGELALLDDDNNGWIDENDKSFAQLRIWEKGADGIDKLSTLLEKDVGAISTRKVETGFDLVNLNEKSGVIRETGIWLKESGGVGFMQELDIVA